MMIINARVVGIPCKREGKGKGITASLASLRVYDITRTLFTRRDLI